MAFKIKIEPDAKQDIQNEINYYNQKKKGLGKRLHTEVSSYLKAIKDNPCYAIRYDKVRCIPLKIFPLMIHFTIEDSTDTIIIRAVINTHKDPKKHWL